jgi:hypothetical protein
MINAIHLFVCLITTLMMLRQWCRWWMAFSRNEISHALFKRSAFWLHVAIIATSFVWATFYHGVPQ